MSHRARDGGAVQGPDGSVKSGTATGPTVWLYRKGKAQKVPEPWARRNGYTVIDLSDDWTPFIFSEGRGQDGRLKPNGYRKIYVGLANDRTDNWGKPLRPGRHNYLELYGVPPTLTVLRKRFLDDQQKLCFRQIDLQAFREKLPYAVRYTVSEAAFRFKKRYEARLRTVKGLLRRLRLQSVEQLSRSGKHRWAVKAFRRTERAYRALVQAQKRMRCEGVLKKSDGFRHGAMDWATHLGLKRFEQKHMVFGWGMIWKETREVMGRTPLQNNHAALVRMLRERVVTTIPVLEDGTVTTYKDSKGRTHRIRNLVQEFKRAAVTAMGWETPKKALAFFKRTDPATFKRFRVAMKLPPLPAHYSSQMDFEVKILRGDVWYDFPYDEKGKEQPQPRAMRPKIKVLLRNQGQLIPLAKWGTTIGGWRTEMRDGLEYWKYKKSPIGWTQWKYVVAAPVWFPPVGTPPRDLVKNVKIRGRWRTVVKREETGPGYASAYGLVAALHTQERRRGSVVEDVDHGIRTHGSVNYMSIMRYHSHGCHRLHNHLAVRLFTFILKRHPHLRLGQQDQKWTLPFQYKGKRYALKLNSKGYYYQMLPPVKVFVTRGRILGKTRLPVAGFMRKANIRYPGPDGSVPPVGPDAGAPPSSAPPRPVSQPVPPPRPPTTHDWKKDGKSPPPKDRIK
jgi:hypothetical protein